MPQLPEQKKNSFLLCLEVEKNVDGGWVEGCVNLLHYWGPKLNSREEENVSKYIAQFGLFCG